MIYCLRNSLLTRRIHYLPAQVLALGVSVDKLRPQSPDWTLGVLLGREGREQPLTLPQLPPHAEASQAVLPSTASTCPHPHFHLLQTFLGFSVDLQASIALIFSAGNLPLSALLFSSLFISINAWGVCEALPEHPTPWLLLHLWRRRTRAQ